MREKFKVGTLFSVLKSEYCLKHLTSKIRKIAAAIKFTEQKRRHDGCRVLADKFDFGLNLRAEPRRFLEILFQIYVFYPIFFARQLKSS